MAVVPATRNRLTVLASAFGLAFADEPMMRWPLGVHGDVVDRFTHCFSFFLHEVLDLGVVSQVGNGTGGAVWIPPDQLPSWEDHPWNQERILALCDDGGRRYDGFWRWVDEHAPDEPSWQLDSIAVHPRAQGNGYGAALIAAGQARARADGKGAFLSTGTARNVSIYSRCGFRLVDEADAPDGGPHIWFMRWDP
jgi:GNAT superfamily N-acetyltransferase